MRMLRVSGLIWLFNKMTDSLFNTRTLRSFHSNSYKPPNETINAYVARLLKVNQLLDGTINTIPMKLFTYN